MNTLDTDRRSKKQTRGIALFVASVLMVAACSSSDDGGLAIENSQTDDTTSDEVQLDDYVATPGSLLAEIGLSADVTEPLDTVALTGVAADDTADLELWIRTADGDVLSSPPAKTVAKCPITAPFRSCRVPVLAGIVAPPATVWR